MLGPAHCGWEGCCSLGCSSTGKVAPCINEELAEQLSLLATWCLVATVLPGHQEIM